MDISRWRSTPSRASSTSWCPWTDEVPRRPHAAAGAGGAGPHVRRKRARRDCEAHRWDRDPNQRHDGNPLPALCALRRNRDGRGDNSKRICCRQGGAVISLGRHGAKCNLDRLDQPSGRQLDVGVSVHQHRTHESGLPGARTDRRHCTDAASYASPHSSPNTQANCSADAEAYASTDRAACHGNTGSGELAGPW